MSRRKPRVGPDPDSASRTSRALNEVCANLGFCDVSMIPEAAAAFHGLVGSGAAADELVDAILDAEGSARWASPHRAALRGVVEDWLFDPQGRGAQSGLPRA